MSSKGAGKLAVAALPPVPPPLPRRLPPHSGPCALPAGIAAKVLKSMGVTLKDARVEVEKIIGRGSGFVAVEIPFTPRAKRVLELSLEEARALGACREQQPVSYADAPGAAAVAGPAARQPAACLAAVAHRASPAH